MATDKYGVYQGDYGHKIELQILDYNELTGKDVAVDLNEFTTLKVVVISPTDVEHELTATMLNTGTDGWLTATTTSGVFTELGYYQIRAQLSNALQLFHTTTVGYRNLKK